MRSLTVLGLLFCLWGVWSIFDSPLILVIGIASVISVALLVASWRWHLTPALGVAVVGIVFVALAQWVVFVIGWADVDPAVGTFWTDIGVGPSVLAMLFGQAMMLFGAFGAWSNQLLRDFHRLDG